LRIDQRDAFDMNGRVIDYAEVMAGAGRNACPRLIYQWDMGGLLGVEQLRKLLPDAWTGAEFPARALPHWYWVDLFRKAGFMSDTLTEIGEVTTIYRGAVQRRRKGMPWTLDPERANWWFAKRNAISRLQGRICSAEVARKDVLAIFFNQRRGRSRSRGGSGRAAESQSRPPIVRPTDVAERS
jgi:hypothetical protein